MKILYISYLFAPMNIIGAVRPTKVVDGLSKKGYIVDVVTAEDATLKMDGLKVPNGLNNVYKIKKRGFFKLLADIPKRLMRTGATTPLISGSPKTTTVPAKRSFKRRIRSILSQTFLHFDFLAFLSGFKKACKAGKIGRDYDVIYTSYGPLSTLLCGIYAKKKMSSAKWICEFRDPVVTDVLVKEFRGLYTRIQAKACRLADKIIAVSNGYVERICGNNHREKTYMIPNGYDLGDKPVLLTDSDTDKLNLTYVGVLYLGRRDLSPIFLALKELIDENKIEKEKIVFNYAGVESSVATAQAAKFGLDDIVVDHGVLNREACLELQMRSHFLLLATWNDKNEYGVFPGKVLEYMLIGKPIISLTCGDLAGGEITRVIREGNFGFAYEEATHSQDSVALKKYLENLYNSWVETGIINFEPQKDVLDRYNYENIIERIEALIIE